MELKAKRLTARYTSLIFIILLGLNALSLGGNLLAWMQIDTLINSHDETYIPTCAPKAPALLYAALVISFARLKT